jgi:hypothetical protein
VQKLRRSISRLWRHSIFIFSEIFTEIFVNPILLSLRELPFQTPQLCTILRLFEILLAVPSPSNITNITNNSHPLTTLTFPSVLLDSAVFQSCGSLYRACFRTSFAFRKQTYLHRKPDRWDSILLRCNFLGQNSSGMLNVLISHVLHKFNVKTDHDCGNSLIYPQYFSAAMGEFTEVKTWSFIFRYLKIKFDSKEINFADASFQNYCQTSIYLSKTDIAYRILR